MKNFYLIQLIIVILLMVSCNNNTNNQGTTNKEESINEISKTVSIEYKSVVCTIFDENERCVKISTGDTMFMDEKDLSVISDTLKITKNVMFYVKDLIKYNENYAERINKIFYTHNNVPKNIREYEINQKYSKYNASIEEIQKLKSYKKIDFSEVPLINKVFNNAAKCYSLEDYPSEPKIKEIRNILKKELIKEQKRLFPMMRKAAYLALKNNLWEENIEVKLNDKNLFFIGSIFYNNKNIKDCYNEGLPIYNNCRFKNVYFKGSNYDNATYYELNTPNDDEISMY